MSIETAHKKKHKRSDPSESPLMVQSVQKAFRVLTAFSAADPRLTLTQLVDKLDIDKSTAQRFTHTLQFMGYLDKDPVTKTLGVTTRVLDLAHTYLAASPLVAAALPYLSHLNNETKETVNLTVLDGPDVMFISRIVGRHLLSTGVIIGTRLPAYATAAGLAMMSRLDEGQLARVLATSDLKPYTQHTVFEPQKILARLKSIRKKGYAVSAGDYISNDISIGAPILSTSGQVVGGLALAVTSQRFTPSAAEEEFSKHVLAAARSIQV